MIFGSRSILLGCFEEFDDFVLIPLFLLGDFKFSRKEW